MHSRVGGYFPTTRYGDVSRRFYHRRSNEREGVWRGCRNEGDTYHYVQVSALLRVKISKANSEGNLIKRIRRIALRKSPVSRVTPKKPGDGKSKASRSLVSFCEVIRVSNDARSGRLAEGSGKSSDQLYKGVLHGASWRFGESKRDVRSK